MVDIERLNSLDELMEYIPADLVRAAENRRAESMSNTSSESNSEGESNVANETKKLSKAKRIRQYLEENLDARNKDVVDALSKYGVTSADVGNVRSLIKRTGNVPVANSKKPTSKRTEAASHTETNTTKGSDIGWQELDAGVNFVKVAGSIQRAKHLLIIIEQIKAC